MSGVRIWLILAYLLLAGHSLVSAQPGRFEDRPGPFPASPPSRQELDQRESLQFFLLGLLCEREDRLLEALQAFEQAAKLDPEAPGVWRVQIPLLLALERGQDALAACKKTLDLDPADHATWFIFARVQRTLGNFKECRQALERGLASPGLKDHADVAQQMYFDLGMLLETSEEYAGAVGAFVQAVRILDHPEHLSELVSRELIHRRAAEIYERIGHLERKLKHYNEAVAAYKLSQERHPQGAGRLNLNLAQVCTEQEKFDQALAYADAYLRLLPQGLEAYELKIQLLDRLGRGQAIVPWIEQATAADTLNVGLKLLLSQQYMRFRQYPQAEKLFLAMAAKDPSNEIYRGLFQLYRQDPGKGMGKVLELVNQTFTKADPKKGREEAEVAAPHARAMIAALRDDKDLAKELVQAAFRTIDQNQDLAFETVHMLAVLADRQKQVVEAERFYRKSLPLATPASEALVYSGLLRTLWKARKFADIIALCHQGLKNAQATKPILFHTDLALALARLDRIDEALQAADQAVMLAADNDKLYVRRLRVRILALAERFPQAEAECLDLIKEQTLPGDIMEIRYLLSSVYSSAKQLAKAEEQLGLVLKMDPNNATANNDLGYIWADQGKNLPEAEEMIRKAIELERRNRKLTITQADDDNHDNAAYIDSLGWVLFRRGQIDAARKELERAVSLPEGEDATIWDHLGDVYFRLNLVTQARSSWRKAVEILEKEPRRRSDERYRDIQRKIKLVAGK